jgi:glycosyltransferase involved in cell wall biosynthesis
VRAADELRGLLDRLAKTRNLLYEAETLRARLEEAEDEIAALKSSVDVAPELHDEYARWRRTPLPERPLVSVLTATYNRGELLTSRCIPSVLEQSYDNLELIVVGDGCTDETEELVAAIDDPRLRFVNLPRRAAYPSDGSNRWMVAGGVPTNEALGMARGELIAHLDDDDEYLPDRLRRLVEFMGANDCDLVWHPFWWESGAGHWRLEEAERFARGHVTNLSVMYRSWFTRFRSEPDTYRLSEPGDWNRFRRMAHVAPVVKRYPEPLSRHYEERGARVSNRGRWL